MGDILSLNLSIMGHSIKKDEQGSDAIDLGPLPSVMPYGSIIDCQTANGMTGLSPIELLTGTRSDHCDLPCTHIWGCPVYVLDPKLQDSRWTEDSKIELACPPR